MNTNKFLIGGVVAGVLYFGLGYVVWGILLKEIMEANVGSAGNVMKEGDPEWVYLIVGNLFSGLALAYVLNKAGAKNLGAGFLVGATIGLLWSAGFDFTMLGVTNLSTMKGTLIDIAASTVVSGVIGGITCWVLGMMDKKAT